MICQQAAGPVAPPSGTSISMHAADTKAPRWRLTLKRSTRANRKDVATPVEVSEVFDGYRLRSDRRIPANARGVESASIASGRESRRTCRRMPTENAAGEDHLERDDARSLAVRSIASCRGTWSQPDVPVMTYRRDAPAPPRT